MSPGWSPDGARKSGFYELHPVRGGASEQPDACCERLGSWSQPCDRFRVSLECVTLVPGERPSAAVRWREHRIEEQLETLGGAPIRRTKILRRDPPDDFALSLLPEGKVANDLLVEIELVEPLAPAFTPYQTFPRRPGELSFDEIVEKLAAKGLVRISGVHEADHWWAFGCFQIGSCGYAVKRLDGRVTAFGSAFPWRYWIWGYDHGLVCSEHMDLVVTSVFDLERAVALLDKLRISWRGDNRLRLASPPVVFERAVNWLAIRELHDSAPAAFSWTVRPSS